MNVEPKIAKLNITARAIRFITETLIDENDTVSSAIVLSSAPRYVLSLQSMSLLH